MNLDVYNSLSDEHKAIVAAASAAENDIMLAEFNARKQRRAEHP